MPDTSTLEMPGASGQSKGPPGWLMVVGAVAGVVGLVLLLKSGGGGGGTTAAGTSINAALGSIQEENMNLLGVTQQGFQGMTTGFLNTQNQIGGLGTQVGAGFSQTNGLLTSMENDIMNELSAFSGQTQASFANLAQMQASGQASQAQQASAFQALLTSIQQDVQSGLVGQAQANAALSTIETDVLNSYAGTTAQLGAVNQNILNTYAGTTQQLYTLSSQQQAAQH